MESKFFFLLLRFAGSVLPPSHMRGIGIIGRRVLGFLARRISPHIGRGAYVFPDTVLGDGSGIGANCEICRGLVVGKNVMMGPECLLYSTNHKFDRENKRFEGYTEIRPITLEDDVWPGRRVIVMAGVTVGRGSVVGAGAVVTKDIPPYSLAAGNPAVVKKNLPEG
ncbi:acyltransferase [Neisseria gonorrhoeae]|uniref:acyltransferase n=1 Tax=Neisseria gonorrhoeae TaxID=485 RepID=UPI0001AF7CDA|nr:acyltransferase [Neisseria gonorrhoeae]AKP13605.1 Putative acetyltransferase [Neisseria gonorrhoeae]KLS84548.1 acetyltransferase [Neisseria gonorrhoeae MU_NG4]MCF3023787.1 acyltransferase [Neisseria gonorrhoeae]MCF3029868.1 acyltransferase [Neisseria gonorrhoeae]MCF3043897.1 acyltransferase [Neisseria gonorrhoeae]